MEVLYNGETVIIKTPGLKPLDERKKTKENITEEPNFNFESVKLYRMYFPKNNADEMAKFVNKFNFLRLKRFGKGYLFLSGNANSSIVVPIRKTKLLENIFDMKKNEKKKNKDPKEKPRSFKAFRVLCGWIEKILKSMKKKPELHVKNFV